jgi:hypothetical protein
VREEEAAAAAAWKPIGTMQENLHL